MDAKEEEALTGAYHMMPEDENILTYDAVPMVDLSLVYSPVVTPYGAVVSDIMRTHGGGYLLNFGRVQNLRGQLTTMHAVEVVTEDELRVMRARFLIRRDYYALYFECQPLAYYEQDRLLHDYFGGAFYQPPKELLQKSRRLWRLHLEAVRSALPPDKWTVEGQLRELASLLNLENKGKS